MKSPSQVGVPQLQGVVGKSNSKHGQQRSMNHATAIVDIKKEL